MNGGQPSTLPSRAGPVLVFEGVRFRWRGARHDTLDIAHFAVDARERVLLRGPSGAGKSTLLALAAGVLVADQGAVRLLGRDWKAQIPGQRDRTRAECVGYVFQQFNLLPYLSARDNVLLPCRICRARRERAGPAPAARADALLEALGIGPAERLRDAAELSVGQQQRVAAARALIGAPALVIADEPTSALDDDRRDGFMDLLGTECARANAALLMVSHDKRLAPHFDRVVELAGINGARPVHVS